MKKYSFLLLVVFLIAVNQFVLAKPTVVDSLLTIDPNISKYFPRWKLCDQNLQIQIRQAFLLAGYSDDTLDMQNIEVLSAPQTKASTTGIYEILLVTCGKASMKSVELDEKMKRIKDILAGNETRATRGQRNYCYKEIPADLPPSESQASAIINYLEPPDVQHAIVLSLFEQSLKIGTTGFWFRSSIGNDAIGYPFWSSGESNIIAKVPLYENQDNETKDVYRHILTANVGGNYRITSGVYNTNSILSWVTSRKLSGAIGGKLNAGLDFNLPIHPNAGLHINMELPLKKIEDESIEQDDYWFNYDNLDQVQFTDGRPCTGITYMLRSSGQVTAFYNYWLNPKNPENFFRFELGLSYSEVREFAAYDEVLPGYSVKHLTTFDVEGLKTYKPNEFGDWLFAKVEYRNQSVYPFQASIQYSNQMLLTRVYIPFPLIGNWLYLEGKYATPLRGVRPYEIQNFFMFSPVLRITL